MAGEFDTLALRLRADEWRDEAARVAAGAMRDFCLREARQCEWRLQRSSETPIIHEHCEIRSESEVDAPQSMAFAASG